MPISVKVIKDSTSKVTGKRITTLQVRFHRFILPEFNTHRVFSRNFSSSRAIPTAKLIDQVRTDPAMPVFWGKNQAGMQAKEEVGKDVKYHAEQCWLASAKLAATQAEDLAGLGLHKQIVNRVLEPFLWVEGIVTSTEFDNWEALRAHEDAQPEIQALAYAMKEARKGSTPEVLKEGEWHLPYITEADRAAVKEEYGKEDPMILAAISAARCCRVSYLKHDGTAPSIKDDILLCDRLAKANPIHFSPFEHQATPAIYDWNPIYWGNFQEWNQHRKIIEDIGYTSYLKD